MTGFPSTVKACGTIELNSNHLTAIARFKNKVAGDVVIRQVDESNSLLATVFSNLFFVDGTSENMAFRWKIYSKVIQSSESPGDRCKNLMEVFNPSVSNSICSSGDQSTCAMGDMSGKHGNITVATVMGGVVHTFLDTNIAIHGSSSASGRTIVLLNANDEVVDCAPITQVTERKAKAWINQDNVMGWFMFSQKSPFDPTKSEIQLEGLADKAHNYHVHLYPVPERVLESEDVCSNDNVGGHWNPFNVVFASSPAATTGTDDQYEVK